MDPRQSLLLDKALFIVIIPGMVLVIYPGKVHNFAIALL